MSAVSLESARTIGLLITVACGILGIGAAVLMRSVGQKLALAAIFGLLALFGWSQRAALDDCATAVRAAVADLTERTDAPTAPSAPTDANTVTCSFFGQQVPIPD